MQRFEQAKSDSEGAVIEKLAHTMSLCTRLHNEAAMLALLPLVKQLKKGGTLSKSMGEKVQKVGGRSVEGRGQGACQRWTMQSL